MTKAHWICDKCSTICFLDSPHESVNAELFLELSHLSTCSKKHPTMVIVNGPTSKDGSRREGEEAMPGL